MIHGKNICNQLKAVRKHIAEENGIPLEMKKCTYKGACSGTCPRCEAEMRYLENALIERMRLGKVATVAGLALGLVASASAQAQVDTAKTAEPDTTGRKMQKLDAYMQTMVPNDAPEMIAVRKLSNRRPLAGEVIAEIQVILGGTPASYGTGFDSHPFYEEKKEDEVRIKAQ